MVGVAKVPDTSYVPSRILYLVRETRVEPSSAWSQSPPPEEPVLPPANPLLRPCAPESDALAPAPDLDALLEMEDEIRSLSVQIHVATHRLLLVLAEFDRQRGWEVGGHRCCADWLAHRTGIDRGAARERVRAARALVKLPVIGDAMAKGDLSFSQVRALTRVATPDTQDELLSLAMENSSPALERIVRGWRRGNRNDEARRDEELHRSRGLSVFPDEEGMIVVKGVLPAELGLLLLRALDAASDALFREEGRTPAAVDPEGTRAASARRRADALGLLAERALAAGFTADEGAPVSGTRPERYQVVLHVEQETLRQEEEGPGDGTSTCPPRSHLDDGTRVSMETSRRLCCDAAVVTVHETRDGQPLNIGRKRRTISPRCAGPWRCGIAVAASPDAGAASPMPITSSTGPTAGKPPWPTACCSAASTTASSMRGGGGSSGGERGNPCSWTPGEGRSSMGDGRTRRGGEPGGQGEGPRAWGDGPGRATGPGAMSWWPPGLPTHGPVSGRLGGGDRPV